MRVWRGMGQGVRGMEGHEVRVWRGMGQGAGGEGYGGARGRE